MHDHIDLSIKVRFFPVFHPVFHSSSFSGSQCLGHISEFGKKEKKKCQKIKIRSASWTRLSYSQICSSCKDINMLVHSEGKGRHRGLLSQSLKFKYSSNCIPTHCLGSNKHTHFTRLHTYSGLLSSTPNQFCLVTTGWTEDLDFNFKAWMRKQESLKQSRRVERITPALLSILPNL